jgi:hypothetical protein
MPPRWVRLALHVGVIGGLLLVLGNANSLPVAASEPANNKQLCQAVLDRALNLTEAGCLGTGRNQACYGYTAVHSKLQPGVDPVTNRFDTGGDIVPVRSLALIRTASLDLEQGTWGMAILKMQANLPDTNPGQNITFILFGDTSLEPDTSRTSAFYLSTELGELTCKQIPQNSLLVRAPSHTTVTFAVNGVEIAASSIVVLRSSPRFGLSARVLEGHVSVTAQGQTVKLLAGQQLSVPMRAGGLSPAGPPSAPTFAPREDSLDLPTNFLGQFDPTADVYLGPVTLEGPIEALNPIMPSLTMYGQIVLLDKVIGWRKLRAGQWVRIKGRSLGYLIQAEGLSTGPRPLPTKLPVRQRPGVTSVDGSQEDSNLPGGQGGGSSGGSQPGSQPTLTEQAQTPTPPPTKLQLSAMCSPDPNSYRVWRVGNPNPYSIPFSWDVQNSDQKGAGVAPASGETFFQTKTVDGRNKVHLYANGELQDFQISNGTNCNPPTPTPVVTQEVTVQATQPATVPATAPATIPATESPTEPPTDPAPTEPSTPPAPESPMPPATPEPTGD